MTEDSIRNARVENLDEDEDKTKGAGRPNAWWADQRAKEAEEQAKEAGPDNFEGSFRGTRAAPRGGAQSVTPSDVHGSLDLCWCGEPLDHDWPGKAQGRRHPRKVEKKVATDTRSRERIERRQLRAYHDDLQEVILEAVNSYGARYRLRQNSIMLYPPDGSEPFQIYARNTDRQTRSARLWFVRHCVQVSGKPSTDEKDNSLVSTNPVVRDPKLLLDDADRRLVERKARELAEALNSPEHPVPPETDTTVAAVTYQDTPAEPADYLPPQETSPVDRTEAEWTPYASGKGTTGKADDLFETNGTLFRCKACLGTSHEYVAEHNRGIGGHIRIYHTDNAAEDLWGPEAREKATESGRTNRLLREQVEAVIELLQDVVGTKPPDHAHVAALEAEKTALEAENADLKTRLAAADRQATDAEAKLSLLREALEA